MKRSALMVWVSLVPFVGVWGVWGVCGVGQAQETSDLMKPVQSQIEKQNELQQPGWRSVTGQTLRPPSATTGQGQVPAGGGEGAGPEGTAEGSEAEGRGHGAAVLDEDVRAAPRVQVEGEEGLVRPPGPGVPGGRQLLHQIQPGDTLSGISQRYFGTPDAWPRLWSLNPEITNPHWIYPGATLRLVPPTVAPALPRSAPAPAAAPAPRSKLTVSRPRPPGGVLLLRNAFVEGGELALAGKIVGSADEKNMLVTLDEAYVEFKKQRDDKAPIRPGQRYTVYRERSEVKHPKTRQPLGSLVEILGEVELLEAAPNGPCKVRIMEALGPIERGDRIGPLHRHVKLVEPEQARVELEGVVVATLRPMELLGSDMLVFIDRGRKDGVVEGNRFQVVRRGDPNRLPLETSGLNDTRFPREVVAEILIVEVRDQTSGGVVVSAFKETHLGDRVELRRGP